MSHRCLTYDQAAAILSISSSTLTRLVRVGDLPTVSVGGVPRIRLCDLAAYIDALPTRKDRP